MRQRMLINEPKKSLPCCMDVRKDRLFDFVLNLTTICDFWHLIDYENGLKELENVLLKISAYTHHQKRGNPFFYCYGMRMIFNKRRSRACEHAKNKSSD